MGGMGGREGMDGRGMEGGIGMDMRMMVVES